MFYAKLGLDVIEIPYYPEWIGSGKGNRHHKKKRIHKKWLKIYGEKMVKVESEKCYLMGNKLIATKGTIELFKNMEGIR